MIAVVKYNAGNIKSLINALDRIGVDYVYTDDPDVLLSADKVIFPGVGEAKSAMDYLRAKDLDQVLKQLKNPFLGICLGMQLMCNHSEERDTEMLGIFDTKVKLFPPADKVPHIGWNDFIDVSGLLFDGIDADSDMYFVHSFYAELSEQTVAKTKYIKEFSAALQNENFYGVQFHPEKSAHVGQRLIQNFLDKT